MRLNIQFGLFQVVCTVLGSVQSGLWPTQTAPQAVAENTNALALTVITTTAPTCTSQPVIHHLRRQLFSYYPSICGFVTSDAHYPVACNEGEFCTTDGNHAWQCCSTATIVTTVTSYVDTYTQGTTILSTVTVYTVPHTLGVNCTNIAATTCYDQNHAASCTGACASTACVCQDPNYPACASLTSSGYSSDDYTFAFCDTTAYGLPVDAGTVNPLTATETSTPSVGYTFTFAQPNGSSEATAAATSNSAMASSTTSASGAAYLEVATSILYAVCLTGLATAIF